MNLIEQIDDILPQTQCRQCGYDGCMAYACAIALDGAPINRCAPGGQKGIDELARLLDRPSCELDPEYGQEMPLEVAQINAEHCIGCRKCVAFTRHLDRLVYRLRLVRDALPGRLHRNGARTV